MKKEHHYKSKLQWTGNTGSGTTGYRDFERSYAISIENKPDILGSSDPSFRGDATKYNPEELLVASLSSCHMLWYLHLCSVHKIIVTEYIDNATGIMEETKNGSGKFAEVTLNPKVKVTEENMIAKANELHEEANKMCFIANSCNFKIGHIPNTTIQ